MAVSIAVSEVIERPVGEVFTFYADDHVQNHPRWDPDIELWLDSQEPLDVGTVIQRRNSRSGTPVEGTVEVVEFERDRAFGALITDGPMQIPGRAVFESLGPGTTKLTVVARFPVDDSLEDRLSTAMKRSLTNIKRMMEETEG
ncbi:SRPBCC family protein [Glycomyces sp. L485]|uniref:SRPBCC family protein n=1 Tax=Glycomyces sp. L485 TaxID=2909235 RepID=UPI001F4A3858|nr:SRPBCC family protein [Glycomyces sp. L485]MCH7229823.1 SRPBCC family protein [Glycomyces sp. L485]